MSSPRAGRPARGNRTKIRNFCNIPSTYLHIAKVQAHPPGAKPRRHGDEKLLLGTPKCKGHPWFCPAPKPCRSPVGTACGWPPAVVWQPSGCPVVRLLSAACCPVVVRFKSGQQPDNKRTTSGQQGKKSARRSNAACSKAPSGTPGLAPPTDTRRQQQHFFGAVSWRQSILHIRNTTARKSNFLCGGYFYFAMSGNVRNFALAFKRSKV